MTETDELSVLEYARFHHVAADHLAIDPDHFIRSISQEGVDCTTDSTSYAGTEEAKDFILGVRNEKLNVSKASAAYISSIIKPQSQPGLLDGIYLDELLSSHRKVNQLKLDPPILRPSNEHDLAVFRSQVSFENLELDLPLEDINDENDEGTVFPSYAAYLATEIPSQVSQEKLNCAPEALRYLQRVRSLKEPSAEIPLYQLPRKRFMPQVENDDIQLTPRNFDNDRTVKLHDDTHNMVENDQGHLTPREDMKEENSPQKDALSYSDVPKPNGKNAINNRFTLLPPHFSAPGRLTTFMSLRGKAKRQKIDHCPYFSVLEPPGASVLPKGDDDQRSGPSDCSEQSPQRKCTMEIGLPPASDIRIGEEPFTFFMSTSLLQTHRTMVYRLETISNPPVLVFRDSSMPNSTLSLVGCKDNTSYSSIKPGKNQDPWIDADITLSPTTGVLLSTPQETAQLYIPGHSLDFSCPGVDVNSPLRERIYRTCMKYEQLYMLICHTASETSATKSIISVDERTLHAFRSLDSFCGSLKEYSHVSAINIPSNAESLAGWIISLANKHHAPYSRLDDLDIAPTVTGVGRRPFFSQRRPPEDATSDELILRRLGLNCFAAWWALSTFSSIQEGIGESSALVEEETKRLPKGIILASQILNSVNHNVLSHTKALRIEEQMLLLKHLKSSLGERAVSRIERWLLRGDLE